MMKFITFFISRAILAFFGAKKIRAEALTWDYMVGVTRFELVASSVSAR